MNKLVDVYHSFTNINFFDNGKIKISYGTISRSNAVLHEQIKNNIHNSFEDNISFSKTSIEDIAPIDGNRKTIINDSSVQHQVLCSKSSKITNKHCIRWFPDQHQLSPEVIEEFWLNIFRNVSSNDELTIFLEWPNYNNPGYITLIENLLSLDSRLATTRIGVYEFDSDHIHLLVHNSIDISCNLSSFSILEPQHVSAEAIQLYLNNDISLFAKNFLCHDLLSESTYESIQNEDYLSLRKCLGNIAGDQIELATIYNCINVISNIAKFYHRPIEHIAAKWVEQQPFVSALMPETELEIKTCKEIVQQPFTLKKECIERIDNTISRFGNLNIDTRRWTAKLPDNSFLKNVYESKLIEGRQNRWRVSTNEQYENICGYSRAVRVRNHILVSGTTATLGHNRVISINDPAGQTVFIFDKISASLQALGSSLDDVVRTRLFLNDATEWEPISLVHGRYFSNILPANTLIEIGDLVGHYHLEVEVDAIV